MNGKSAPLVTAIIPTRNRASLLQNAVESVFNQTYGNLEIVVVDDASDDETVTLLKNQAGNNPVSVIRNDHPLGAAACRNIAIRNAKGEFIAGLDDDDTWEPRRIELLMKHFKSGYSAVSSYDRMNYASKSYVWKKKPVITLDDLLYYNMTGNQVLTKKEYIMAVDGYDESLPSAQDYDLWIRLAQKFGPVHVVREVLQQVNLGNNRDRITTSFRKIEGYKACFEKHRSHMNEKQIQYQLYRIKLAEKGQIGWTELFRAVPFKLLRKEITRKLFL